MSAVKTDSFSSELVREATSFSVSLVEIPTALLEDALALPLDFLFMTVSTTDFRQCQDGPTLSLLKE